MEIYSLSIKYYICYNISFPCAGEEHWNILIIECKPLAAEWTKVSSFLGLTFGLIDSIKQDHPNDSFGYWSEALKQWIKQNYNTEMFGRPSWQTLLKAVAEVDKLLFERLATKHSGMTNGDWLNICYQE